MLFKYFIEFDDDGEIKKFHKSKKDCKECKEYLVKLIPVNRKAEELKQKLDKNNKVMEGVLKGSKKLETEFNKMIKNLKMPGRMMR